MNAMTSPNDLRDKLWGFCEVALEMLKSCRAEHGVPTDDEPHYRIDEQGNLNLNDERSEPDWYWFVDEHFQELESLQEAQNALGCLENDAQANLHFGKMVGIDGARSSLTSMDCLKQFLAEIITQKGDLELSWEVFDSVFADLTCFFNSQKLSFRYLALLTGIELSSSVLKLDNNLAIVKLSNKEKVDLLNDLSWRVNSYDALNLAEINFGLEMIQHLDKIVGDKDEPPLANKSGQIVCETFTKVCTALRLFLEGRFGYYEVQRRPQRWIPIGLQDSSSAAPIVAMRYKIITLSPAYEQEFLQFWKTVQSLPPGGPLDIAIRKFNDLYRRQTLEDQVLDMPILFESTLLAGIKEELKYRLALRGACLLKEKLNAGETFELLKKLYDIRSDIVHEGTRVPQNVKIQNKTIGGHEFVREVKDICRQVIQCCISAIGRKCSLRNIMEALDTEIVDRLSNR